ncbi:dockerin type I domain-containing protein [Hominimerdicola sp. 21CYCFAH17_S]
MNFRKFTAIGLACALAAAAFTGCGKKDGKSSEPDGKIEQTDYYNAQHEETGWEWGNVEIVGGGFVPNVIYNPTEEGLAYARTDIGGAYKLNKDTNRWECITDFIGGDDWNLMGIESIATDPVEPNRLYLAAGTYTTGSGAVLVSDDYGENFMKVDLPFGNGGNEVGRGAGERLQVDPNDNSIIYFGTRNAGLYRSVDYGRTWNKVESFPTDGGYTESGYSVGLTFVAFDKASSESGNATKTIFVGAAKNSGNYVYRSDDAGETWNEIENPMSEKAQNNSRLKPVQGEVSSDGYLYTTWSYKVGPNEATQGAVQKYDIKEGKWEEITPDLIYTCGYSGLSVNPGDPQNIVVTTLCLWGVVDNVFVTYDGGKTWDSFWDPDTEEANYKIDISASEWLDWQGQLKLGWWMTGVAINPFDPDEIMYGTGATIFGTDNLTKISSEPVNLSVRAMGIEETAIFDFVSPNYLDEDTPELYSIMGDIYGFRHDDVSKAPKEHYGDFKSTSLDCAGQDYHYVVRATDEDSGTVYYSSDAAQTWQEVESLPDESLEKSGGQVKLSADGKTIFWQPGMAGVRPFVSDDFGKTWTECEDVPAGSIIETDKVNPKKFYAAYDGFFYMSEDGGKSFEQIANFLVSNITYEACPDTEGDLWIAVGSGGVYYLDTSTGELASVSKDIQACDALGLGKAEKDGDYMTLYMIGEANNEGHGVYMSQDKGVTWTRINDDTEKWGNVNPNISGDPKTFGRCYISTNGRGIIMGNKK